MHRYGFIPAERAQLIEGQFDRILYESAHL
jgi:hypothetical protein